MSYEREVEISDEREVEMSDKQEALWAYWSRVNYFTHFAPLLHKMLITRIIY